MDEPTFEEASRQNADRMPAALRPKTIAAMRKFIECTTDHPAHLRIALELINFGDNEGLVTRDVAATIPLMLVELDSGDTLGLILKINAPSLSYLMT